MAGFEPASRFRGCHRVDPRHPFPGVCSHHTAPTHAKDTARAHGAQLRPATGSGGNAP
jgi:hypothetical protein